MRLRFTTDMTFHVDNKFIQIIGYTNDSTRIDITIQGVGMQQIEVDPSCRISMKHDLVNWLNWHIRRSQEVRFEFIPK